MKPKLWEGEMLIKGKIISFVSILFTICIGNEIFAGSATDSIGAEELKKVAVTVLPVAPVAAVEVLPHLISTTSFADAEREIMKSRTFSLAGVALFKGKDPFSKAILKLTASPWSHVGLIVADQDGQRYCFESTGSATDILKRHVLPQVQIHRWEEVISGYDGGVAARWFKFSEAAAPDLTSFVQENLGKPYEQSLSTLFACITRKNRTDDLTSVFCSELVAEALIGCNILPKASERKAQNYLPRDFAEREFLPLNGAALSVEYVLKEPKTFCGCWCF